MNKRKFKRLTAGYDLGLLFELLLDFNEECFHIKPEETMKMLSRWYPENTEIIMPTKSDPAMDSVRE